MLQEGLSSFLEANVAVSTIVSNRIYASQIPQLSAASPLPAISYHEVHGDGEFTLDGSDPLQYSRTQMSCYGKTYADAKRVARTLRQELEAFTGTLPDGTEVAMIRRTGEVDLFYDAPFIYCTAVDFKIIYTDSGS
jgi:hypothetical protein